MRELGWVVGGPETVVRALLDVVGSAGTLMAFAGWDQDTYHLERWQADVRGAARAEHPPFDPALSEANRQHGRIPERMRTWPGAERGPHPEASMVAIGARAGRLVRPHPDDEPHGAGTPFARLLEADGSVLMLGAPLESITLLHHAEAISPVAMPSTRSLATRSRPASAPAEGSATRRASSSRRKGSWTSPSRGWSSASANLSPAT